MREREWPKEIHLVKEGLELMVSCLEIQHLSHYTKLVLGSINQFNQQINEINNPRTLNIWGDIIHHLCQQVLWYWKISVWTTDHLTNTSTNLFRCFSCLLPYAAGKGHTGVQLLHTFQCDSCRGVGVMWSKYEDQPWFILESLRSNLPPFLESFICIYLPFFSFEYYFPLNVSHFWQLRNWLWLQFLVSKGWAPLLMK